MYHEIETSQLVPQEQVGRIGLFGAAVVELLKNGCFDQRQVELSFPRGSASVQP